MTLKIRATELRLGDYLRGSRQTVTAVSLPRGGRIGLTLTTSGGRVRAVNFNASTTMTIERDA